MKIQLPFSHLSSLFLLCWLYLMSHSALCASSTSQNSEEKMNSFELGKQEVALVVKETSRTLQFSWETKTSSSTDLFILEGRNEAGVYLVIHQGFGLLFKKNAHNFQWESPRNRLSFQAFRVIQSKSNGESRISNVVKVGRPQTAVLKVFPNPLAYGKDLSLKSYLPQSESISIQIMDALGKIIHVQKRTLARGWQESRLTMPEGITHGTYYVHVKSRNQVFTERIVIQ